MDRLLTTAEVAERARTSPSTVRYWRHIGTGPPGAFRCGRRVLYPEGEVERWLRELQTREAATNGAPAA